MVGEGVGMPAASCAFAATRPAVPALAPGAGAGAGELMRGGSSLRPGHHPLSTARTFELPAAAGGVGASSGCPGLDLGQRLLTRAGAQVAGRPQSMGGGGTDSDVIHDHPSDDDDGGGSGKGTTTGSGIQPLSIGSDDDDGGGNGNSATTGTDSNPDIATAGGAVWRGRLLLTLVACLYGTNYTVIKFLGEALGPSAMTALRFGLATLVLAPAVARSQWHAGASDGGGMLLNGLEVGVYAAVGFAAQAWALQKLAASKVALFGSLNVLVVPALDHFLGRRKAKARVVVAAILALVGVMLLQSGGAGMAADSKSTNLLACGIALVPPVLFGLGTWRIEALTRRLGSRGELAIAWGQLAVVAACSGVWAMVSGALPGPSAHLALARNPAIVAGLLWTGLATTALPFFLQAAALKHVSAAEGAVINTLEPLIGSLIPVAVLGEAFGPRTAAGGLLVLMGCLWRSLPDGGGQAGVRRRPPRTWRRLSGSVLSIGRKLVSRCDEYQAVDTGPGARSAEPEGPTSASGT